MKNTVMLSLKSDLDGSVTGKLYSFFEFKIASTPPADINAALSARGIRKFAYVSAKSGVECSFPLKLSPWTAREPNPVERVVPTLGRYGPPVAASLDYGTYAPTSLQRSTADRQGLLTLFSPLSC